MYTLFNKINKKKLVHPTVGTWFCKDLQEAQEMLAAAKEYLVAVGLDDMLEDIVIFDLTNNQELLA